MNPSRRSGLSLFGLLVIGDGRARGMTANVDLSVWKAMASRNGGEIIP